MKANPTSQAKVLVVEDEPLVNLDVAAALQDGGFDTLAVYSADDALTLLETENDVSVVFTDINLPGQLDGLGLAREIDRRWPRINVLLTSSGWPTRANDVDLINLYGRFVEKPYPPAAVVRRVRDIVSMAAI